MCRLLRSGPKPLEDLVSAGNDSADTLLVERMGAWFIDTLEIGHNGMCAAGGAGTDLSGEKSDGLLTVVGLDSTAPDWCLCLEFWACMRELYHTHSCLEPLVKLSILRSDLLIVPENILGSRTAWRSRARL
jgi:hypothetical protein